MRKIALISAAALSLGAMSVSSAQAQRLHGYGAPGAPYGYGRGYEGRRRGISPGAAVGLGIAGLAVGGAAAAAAANSGYGYGPGNYGRGYYGRPAYGYDNGY